MPSNPALHFSRLHLAGFTQSDGLEEIEDAWHEAGGKTSNYASHCFYTEQDQAGALDGRGLYIGFGHLSEDDAKGVAVGHLLRAALESEGLCGVRRQDQYTAVRRGLPLAASQPSHRTRWRVVKLTKQGHSEHREPFRFLRGTRYG